MEDSGTEEVILCTSVDVDVICTSSQMFSGIFITGAMGCKSRSSMLHMSK
jgi:hypothetical protein